VYKRQRRVRASRGQARGVRPRRRARVSRQPLRVALEASAKRSFAWALDWPGWCRAGKTDEAAIETLLAYASQYAPVAGEAGLAVPAAGRIDVEVIERIEGGTATEFGIPWQVVDADREPVTIAEARRQAALVAAAWATFERIAAAAPAELRKGPRGGGRDRDKMIGHVIEADWYYGREIGVRHRQPAPDDRAAVAAIRADILVVLRRPSDGSPLAGRKWPARYAARRIAWHALDHAWEIEDRTEG
jgi:hypothetical protein